MNVWRLIRIVIIDITRPVVHNLVDLFYVIKVCHITISTRKFQKKICAIMGNHDSVRVAC